MRDNLPLLDAMLAAEATQPSLYRPGPYWIGNQKRAVAAIRRHGIHDFRNVPAIGKGFADAVPDDPGTVWVLSGWRDYVRLAATRLPFLRDIFASYVKLARNHARRADLIYGEYFLCRFGIWLADVEKRLALPETMHGGAGQGVEFSGRKYSAIYLDHLMRIENFSRHIDFSKVRSLLEIGGGFGANVHLMLSLYPSIRKIFYIDIPSVLYVATEYLRHFYGDVVRDFSVSKDLERIEASDDDRLEIFCLCPWQIEKLEAGIDVFWNSSSLSEMPLDIVSNYARHVSRVLAPSGAASLILNKDRNDDITSRPADILSAFPGFAFEEFEPAVEHRQHGRYAIGRRRNGSAGDAGAP